MDSIEDQIKLISSKIKDGETAIKEATGKDLLIFIGNTGSGKSTSINYINGCTMESFEMENECMSKIRVSPKSKVPDITKIGYGKNSYTEVPVVVEGNKNMAYLDCPGFFDNRGAETNIANVVNIKNVLKVAKSVKIILTLDFHNLIANRDRGLAEMEDLALKFFGGNQDSVIKNKKSLTIAVTHIDNKEHRVKNLDNLKKEFKKFPLSSQLLDQIITFDPLNCPLEGGFKLNELHKHIDNMKPLTEFKNLFKTVLVPSDIIALQDINKSINKEIESQLEIGLNLLKVDNFKESARLLNFVESLSVIDHPEVNEMIKLNNTKINNKFDALISSFKLSCTQENFTSADKTYELIETSMKFFNKNIQKNINLKELKDFENEMKQKMYKRIAKEKEIQDRCDRMERENREYREREERRQEENKKKEEEYNKDVLYCNIIPDNGTKSFNNHAVDSAYVWKGGVFYKYQIKVNVKKSCDLVIVDGEGARYSLWCCRTGWHYVDYNSSSPTIKKIIIN